MAKFFDLENEVKCPRCNSGLFTESETFRIEYDRKEDVFKKRPNAKRIKCAVCGSELFLDKEIEE